MRRSVALVSAGLCAVLAVFGIQDPAMVDAAGADGGDRPPAHLETGFDAVVQDSHMERPGTFSDDDGSVFEFDIEWIAAAGITRGCNPPQNDRFCPSAHLTRGQMAAFLVRALGLQDAANDPFEDDDDSVFEDDIERLAAAGITRGCNPPKNDRFCPDDYLTRGQMAAFLVRAFGYTDAGDGDLFVDDDDSIFEDDIDRLGTAGVTLGCNPTEGNTHFCPDDHVNRGQMAAFLRRAVEPVRALYEIEKILPPSGAAGLFGDNLATDGHSVLVGSATAWVNGKRTGAAFLLTPNGTGWEWTRIAASDGKVDDGFGRSVAIEGDLLAIGAPERRDEFSPPTIPGAVYVYTKVNGTWVEEKLVPEGAVVGDGVGTSVAISDSRIYAGALMDAHAGPWSGAVYVFERNGTEWVQSKIVASDAHAYQWFGWDVAADGNRLVVGTAEGDGCCGPGTAYVYETVGDDWSETSLRVEADHFGSPVAISGSGVLVGADREGQDEGAAFLFDMETPSVDVFLPRTLQPESFFGNEVAATEGWLAVGGVGHAESGYLSGAAHIFKPLGDTWTRVQVTPPDPAVEQYFARGMAAHGDLLVIGAPGDGEAGSYAGAIYLVRLTTS